MKKSPLALLLTFGVLQTSMSAFAATAPLDLVTPVSDYKIYVTENVDTLAADTQKFTDAIKKGDLATAKKLFPTTRLSYESIEPIAELFSDLDASIDSREDDHENGVNKNGQLDMGLLFICYQADLEKGFITVQTRLNGEPLEEYLKPIGGGYFFTLPGVVDSNDFIGRSLLAASAHTTKTA